MGFSNPTIIINSQPFSKAILGTISRIGHCTFRESSGVNFSKYTPHLTVKLGDNDNYAFSHTNSGLEPV
jgi:hypothetical protein